MLYIAMTWMKGDANGCIRRNDQVRDLFNDAKFLELRRRRSSFAHANVFVVEGVQ